MLIILCLAAGENPARTNEKLVIGPIVEVYISEADIYFSARVDTGASTTSINAEKLKAANGRVEYTIVNERGKESRLSSAIVKESIVKNAESREKRYYVYLTIQHMGLAKKTLVNLNYRGESAYKLLLGRNWLSGNYIVDVDR
ncbi:MAG: RimK/LysX family protein [Gammaproteobacteria bacterium]